MSTFTPSAFITGGLKMTDPVNEPVRDYRPGSSEAVSLEAEIARVGGEVRELPHVVNGERLPISAPVPVTSPHEHSHVLGHYSAVDDGVVDAAIDAALSRLEATARKNGFAIGSATGLPTSIDRIARFARALEERGIALQPVSAMTSAVSRPSADEPITSTVMRLPI